MVDLERLIPTVFKTDEAGNTLTAGALSFVYNQANRLHEAIGTETATRYTYNGRGERVKKTGHKQRT